MKFISFLFYYCKKRIKVALRLQKTVNPLNIKWRWQYWKDKNKFQY